MVSIQLGPALQLGEQLAEEARKKGKARERKEKPSGEKSRRREEASDDDYIEPIDALPTAS